MNTVITLLLHQLGLRNNASVLKLPVYGNLCLAVHRGYKVFNFQHKTVVRIIAPDVEQAVVEREIEGVRQAGLLAFAPDVLRWDIKERWYEEKFVTGWPCYPASSSEPAAYLKIYHNDIVPCLEQMILLQPPVRTTLEDYIAKTAGIMEHGRLSRPALDAKKVYSIRSFIWSMIHRLYLQRSARIDLVFSHGDFSLVNILRTNNGIKVIDWEGAGRRNPLFDLYNYFFTELYYKRATTSIVPNINEAISSLQARLITKAPTLAETLVSLAQIYRKLYYIERVCMLLQRELNNKLLDVILRSIAVFGQYEDTVQKCAEKAFRST